MHLINLKKGFNAKLVAETSYPHTRRHPLQELITPTTFHSAIHLNQLAHQRQYILPSISPSDGVIEGYKEEGVSARRLLHPVTPTPPLLTRTALKCLWVFMFVVFYRSGQKPEAVKVWKVRGRWEEEVQKRSSGELL